MNSPVARDPSEKQCNRGEGNQGRVTLADRVRALIYSYKIMIKKESNFITNLYRDNFVVDLEQLLKGEDNG